MKRKGILWLVVLLPLFAWAIWPSSTGGMAPRPDKNGQAAATEEGGDLAANPSPEPAQAALPLTTQVEDRVAISEPAAAEAIQEPLPHSQDEDALVVHLVTYPERSPLPGADLFFLDLEFQEIVGLDWSLRTQGLSQPEVLIHHSQRYRADENGIVRMPPPDHNLILVGRFENLICLGWGLDTEQSELWMELIQRQEVLVQVLRMDGTPQAEFPVDLLSADDLFGSEFATLTTDASGLANFRDFNAMSRIMEVEDSELVVRLGIPLAPEMDSGLVQKAAVPVSLDNPDPIGLVLPETGSVRIRLIEVGGDEYSGEAAGSLYAKGKLHVSSTDADAADGFLSFPWVGLGLELSCLIRFGESKEDQEFHFHGPRQPGEVVEVEAQRVALPILSGRLIRPDGKGLDNAWVQAESKPDAEVKSSEIDSSFLCDAQGAFRFEIPMDAELEGLTLVVLELESGSEDLGRLNTTIQWDCSAHPNGLDLGDVALVSAPVFASGRVVNESGDGISGAMVTLNRVESEQENQESGTRSWFDRQYAHSNSVGEFLIYGVAQDGLFRLDISADDYAGRNVSVHHGQTGLKIVLGRTADLSGQILLDPDLDSDSIRVSVRHGDHGDMVFLEGANGDFRWLFQGEEAGAATVLIKSELGEVLMDGQDFQLAVGTVLAPPQLNPLDLRGRLNAYRLRVTGESGTGLDATLAIDQEGLKSRVYGDAGQLNFAAAAFSLHAQVNADGYHSKVLDLEPGEIAIQLEAGIPVRVGLPPGLAIPAGTMVVLALSKTTAEGPAMMRRFLEIERGKPLEFRVVDAGEYVIGLIGMVTESSDFHSLEEEISHRIQILDRGQLQEFVFPLTQVDIENLKNAPPPEFDD